MRIGLYEGTRAKYHGYGSDYNAHLDKAIAAAEKLIASGKHDLFPDFETLFKFEGEGRANKEAIFVKQYGPNGAGTTVHGNCRQLENTVNLTKNIVDLFLYTDGLPEGKTAVKPEAVDSYNASFINRDPRMDFTCVQATSPMPRPSTSGTAPSRTTSWTRPSTSSAPAWASRSCSRTRSYRPTA